MVILSGSPPKAAILSLTPNEALVSNPPHLHGASVFTFNSKPLIKKTRVLLDTGGRHSRESKDVQTIAMKISIDKLHPLVILTLRSQR